MAVQFKDYTLQQYYETIRREGMPSPGETEGKIFKFGYSLHVLGVLEQAAESIKQSGFREFCERLHPFFQDINKQGLISIEFLMLLNTYQIHTTKGFENLDRLIEELNKILEKQYAGSRDLREKILRQR